MVYSGENLKEIIFPLGGLGTGSIGLAGNGSLVDWEIFNRPDKGSHNGYSRFSIRAEYPDGRVAAKLIQGDHLRDLSGPYAPTDPGAHRAYGNGPEFAAMAGYSHFKRVRFDGRFPYATLTFSDDDFPGRVRLRAFNPFIPLDADASGIPAAFFEVTVLGREEGVKYTVAFSVRNPFPVSSNRQVDSDRYTAVQLINHGVDPTSPAFGDLTVAVDRPDGVCQEYWRRGTGWVDDAETFWHDLTHDFPNNRHYDAPGKHDHCTVGARLGTVGEGQRRGARFVLSWNIPNCINYWSPYRDAEGRDVTWRNYYATRFADSTASCFYALDRWDSLDRRTARFVRALYASTLDRAVIESICATMSVLKTATVLRLEDGTFYGWEGLQQKAGSCEGSCTHVWSYVYALCFLFPELERTLRDTELRRSTDEHGKMQFRSTLPAGRAPNNGFACLDGQMATVIKIYRDWKLTGNSDWLRDNWESIKRVLEYAWSEQNCHAWDRDRDGVLEGRQHHTLDLELFGPSAWLEGMYLGALKAASEMADALGDGEKAKEYKSLFEQGRAWTDAHLFNGSYYSQQIDLHDRSVVDRFRCPNYWNEEQSELNYQIGDGCELDQLLGQWHANICGLGDLFDPKQRKTALAAMFRNNFKPSLRAVNNVWRVYAANDEAGTVICDYPEGVYRPTLSLPYCDECWTGLEYAFAGLLLSEGFVEEGLRVVRAVRARYNGKNRNPWNEFECGSNYARAMASYALLPLCSGFSFDLPRGSIGFSPIADGDFRCLWSVGTGWGKFFRNEDGARIVLCEGSLTLQSVELSGVGAITAVVADGKRLPFIREGDRFTFTRVTLKRSLRFVRQK